MVKMIELGFYSIDPMYLKYLYSVDKEVYFIPITSAKEKHRKWKNISDEHFLIYEIVNIEENILGNIYKKYSNNKKIHLLAVLDIKKMIPVPTNCYNLIKFSEIKDKKYRVLFEKEYIFLIRIKDKIITKVNKLYTRQKETNMVRDKNCNFNILEKALNKWNKSI